MLTYLSCFSDDLVLLNDGIIWTEANGNSESLIENRRARVDKLIERAMINFTCYIWARKFANQVATSSDYHVKT
jgi:hypothetical protein